MTIFYVYFWKTGRPNQTQVAPGTVFQDVSIHGRSHIRNVSGPPSDFALLAPVRRTGSPSLSLSFEKCIHMKHLFSFQDVIGCSGQFMSKNGHGFCLTVFFLQFISVFSGFGVSSEEKDGSFREGPFEMDISDLFA